MTDISSLDPKTLATKMAGYDIQASQNAVTTQQNSLSTQSSNLSKLKTALTTFRSSLTSLNSATQGMLANSASVSQSTVATVTTTSQANRGTYNLTVSQLASAQQTAYSELTDDIVKQATGSLTLSIQNKSIAIDMGKLSSLADFADAINQATDNPGATASLIKTDGKVQLMLSSDESGLANAISLDTQQLDTSSATALAKGVQISTAQDAKVSIGSLAFSSSSNKLDSLIAGVTINLQTVTAADTPLTVTVGTDTSATQKNLQSFIDAYNSLRSVLNAQGSATGGNDGLVSSLNTELNGLIRGAVKGFDMTRFGVTSDKDGKLTLNSDTLKTQLAKNPQSINQFFSNQGLLATIDKSMNNYLSSSHGTLQSRQNVLDRQQTDVTDRQAKITTRYNDAYNRYLTQFTKLKSAMQNMKSSLSSLLS
ncbi:flagellar filament capping protein FliD [Rosenbergiella australiborealis]|uniref:Flagellar hook-associated protein 2 n=1 Tax=Rosenbergiella australiborealis TaxID=1544696 RepID=A0ABS5T786_9GAMM|nr:flagellar filament capping protein FliD [Rosenbergiella australiborealis]MBT0727578.1 flagellar filament capping protein FliD [Rosenbergiella australiborealis]